ncbi:hypothetical protein FM996_18215 [Methylosinus sporium]|uniref:DUF1640 domain-containing protein n=1 Tax=Methylosinus sporium TaxID=428 RepID=A0A549SGE7_METSR|nr:hypothetical protein [Methylosinus sporium]TRL28706.1 hypothetical protein FM996_18215 [Methylosinus sporium]
MRAAAILKLQVSGFSVEQVSSLAELIESEVATKADLLALNSELLKYKATSISDIENTKRTLELNAFVLERKIAEANTGALKSLIVVALCLQTIVVGLTFFAAVYSVLMTLGPSASIH